MKKKLAFILFLILGIGTVYPKTYKIEGIIRDGGNNKPLSGTLITLQKNGKIFDTKYTTSDGKYAFFRLDSGNYSLTFELNNYNTEERKVLITSTNNITHSFTIYLVSSKPVIARVDIKEYPQKSDYEYFLVNHLFKQYETDSTTLFSSTGECLWNDDHEMLYIGVLHIDIKTNGNVEVLNKSILLGAYEVMPDVIPHIEVEKEEKKSKKLLSLLEKVAKSAEKVISENPGMVLK